MEGEDIFPPQGRDQGTGRVPGPTRCGGHTTHRSSDSVSPLSRGSAVLCEAAGESQALTGSSLPQTGPEAKVMGAAPASNEGRMIQEAPKVPGGGVARGGGPGLRRC